MMKPYIVNILVAVIFAATPVLSSEEPQEIYKSPPIKSVSTTPAPVNPIYSSCIKTARANGLDIPVGLNAIDLVPNSSPTVGGGILFEYKNTIEGNHIAVILEFREDGIWTVEGNFKPGEETYRLISYDDPFIRGFWTREEYEASQSQERVLVSATSSLTVLSP